MRGSKYLMTLFVAAGIGALGVASASAGSDRDETRGIKIGPLGQVFGSPSYNASEARAQATSKRKPIHTSAAAAAAYGSTVKSEPLSSNDPGWKHNYQSWCDVGECR
jgi:hypothetical protein